MARHKQTYHFTLVLLLLLFQVAQVDMYAQKNNGKKDIPKALKHRMKDRSTSVPDSLLNDTLTLSGSQNYDLPEMLADTAKLTTANDTVPTKAAKERKLWMPNSGRATWLATIFPGAGQIYNRKYWKLPIIYGGFTACIYALNWNNQMYRDYSQAYLDIMDNNPNTNSYLDFFAPGSTNNIDTERLKSILKNRKDSYRRNRDLSIFAIIGVYLISIIDAYVDAELSNFDISKDLSLKIEPTIINENRGYKGNSLGLQCSIKF